MSGLTAERPAPDLVIYQPARGFRYAMDPFLLAGWCVEERLPASFLDVGTGSGVIALLLARLGVPGEGTDVRPEWIEIAQKSAEQNGLPVSFRVEDIRYREKSGAELVLCNPPYWPAGSGPLPPDPTRAAARYELNGALAEIVPALCRAGERIALVVPARRGAEASALLASAGRPLRRRTTIDDALVLLEGARGARFERDERVQARIDGAHSPWVREVYARLGVRLA